MPSSLSTPSQRMVIVNFPVFPVNCCFGGPDRATLYVVGYDKVYKIRTSMKGLEYPPKTR